MTPSEEGSIELPGMAQPSVSEQENEEEHDEKPDEQDHLAIRLGLVSRATIPPKKAAKEVRPMQQQTPCGQVKAVCKNPSAGVFAKPR
jgi:hypothetical protein